MSKIFALDPGHGGTDPGAVGNGLEEKEIVLDVCQRVKRYMLKHYPGIDCRLTRNSDKTTSLAHRTNTANKWKADCFVSVHVNSAGATSANGYESFVYTTDGENSKSVALQKVLHKSLAKLWTDKDRRDRGMKKANYYVVKNFKGASVLVELGFIVNSEDAKLLKSHSFLQANAEALADSVAEYLGVTKSVTGGDDVYRVKVDGQQVGAFAEPDNIASQVEKAVRSGKGSVEVSKIK